MNSLTNGKLKKLKSVQVKSIHKLKDELNIMVKKTGKCEHDESCKQQLGAGDEVLLL